MKKNNSTKKIIAFSGGGTGGSVSPLLALKQHLAENNPEWEFVWFGTKGGLEKGMLKNDSSEYIGITSGKFRRYFSLKNFFDIFKIIYAFFESIFYLVKIKPDLIMSAGAFVSVPLVWAASFCGIPVIVHQQDVRPGLANKLMARVATRVSVTFPKSLDDYGKKAVLTGNPVRKEFFYLRNELEIKKDLGLALDRAVITVVGGGQGAKYINNLLGNSLEELSEKYQILHITGKGNNNLEATRNYFPFEFVSSLKMAEILAVSDLVVSRCGLGFITELSFLKKASIFIPIIHSHQEDNAQIIVDNSAGIVLSQDETNKDVFIKKINDVLEDKNQASILAHNLYNIMPREALDNLEKLLKENV